MNILVVEDDAYKANQIYEHLSNANHVVEICGSFRSGMISIVRKNWDLVLLDMSIPSFETSELHRSSRSRKFGGRDILQEMKRNNIEIPAIVVTQYHVFGEEEISLDDLDRELQRDYKNCYKGCVYYNASVLNWKEHLDELMANITD